MLLAGVVWWAATLVAHQSNLPNPFVTHLTRGALFSHLVLLHNFNTGWGLAIDSSMWSVATEWQIYLLFPFVLLPLWRGGGALMTIVLAFMLGLVPVMLLPAGTNYNLSCPWFLGLFAIGMAAAEISVAPRRNWMHISHRWWGIAAVLLFAFMIFLCTAARGFWEPIAPWYKDMIIAPSIACLLIYLALAQRAAPGKQTMVARILECRPLLVLGAFSYSLYLIHLPILDLMLLAMPSHMSPALRAAILFLGAPPILLVCGYTFYLAFEQPKAIKRITAYFPSHLAIDDRPSKSSDARAPLLGSSAPKIVYYGLTGLHFGPANADELPEQ